MSEGFLWRPQQIWISVGFLRRPKSVTVPESFPLKSQMVPPTFPKWSRKAPERLFLRNPKSFLINSRKSSVWKFQTGCLWRPLRVPIKSQMCSHKLPKKVLLESRNDSYDVPKGLGFPLKAQEGFLYEVPKEFPLKSRESFPSAVPKRFPLHSQRGSFLYGPKRFL